MPALAIVLSLLLFPMAGREGEIDKAPRLVCDRTDQAVMIILASDLLQMRWYHDTHWYSMALVAILRKSYLINQDFETLPCRVVRPQEKTCLLQ